MLLTTVVGMRAQITGEILDATDGGPVPYASAVYRGKVAVPSNAEGKFKIERHNGWRLTISSVGYVPQVITITSSTPNHLVIRLKPDTKKPDAGKAQRNTSTVRRRSTCCSRPYGQTTGRPLTEPGGDVSV